MVEVYNADEAFFRQGKKVFYHSCGKSSLVEVVKNDSYGEKIMYKLKFIEAFYKWNSFFNGLEFNVIKGYNIHPDANVWHLTTEGERNI